MQKHIMKNFNTWYSIKHLTRYNFWIPLLVFGVLLNSIAFICTSYYENKVWDRTIIFTYLVYCVLFGLLNLYIYKKFLRSLKATIAIFITGLLIAFFFFSIVFLLSTVDWLVYAFIIIIYAIGVTFYMKNQFRVTFTIRFFTELISLTIISLALISLLNSVDNHYYGLQAMLSASLFKTIYLVLVYSKNPDNSAI